MGDKLNAEDEFNKALFQLRGAAWDILELYNKHGYQLFRDQVSDEIEKVAIQFHARLIGIPDVSIGKDEELISIPLEEAPDD